MKTRRECIICKKMTDGSIGKAGIRWPNLCQDCKDAEDKALEKNLDKLNAAFNAILNGGQQ